MSTFRGTWQCFWESEYLQYNNKEAGGTQLISVSQFIHYITAKSILVVMAQGQSLEVSKSETHRSIIHGQRVVTYFLLGYSREHQEQLLKESSLHKDIIQKNFTDSYYNLTTKVLMGLEWVNRFCPSTSFVVKTDSDMFVNPDYQTELLLGKNRKDFFTGLVMRGYGPVRDRSSQWYISEQEYPQEKYPPFCSGTGYVLSTDVANGVCNVSRIIPYFKLEDVYVGLCLAELKIDPVEIHSERKFYNSMVEFFVCGFRKLVTSHGVNPSELLSNWKSLEDAADTRCPGDE
ncbi:beta-1,3-galactosyltransferase 5-like [Mustelus asterias]